MTIGGGKATEAVLMAPGATTHGADMGQAMVPLKQRPAPVGGKREEGEAGAALPDAGESEDRDARSLHAVRDEQDGQAVGRQVGLLGPD